MFVQLLNHCNFMWNVKLFGTLRRQILEAYWPMKVSNEEIRERSRARTIDVRASKSKTETGDGNDWVMFN